MRKFYPVKNAPADTVLPKRGSKYSAGYDFFAPCDIPIPANSCTKLIFLNVKAEIPKDEYLQLVIRSSVAVKYGIVLETSGVIDADYFGNPDNDGNIGVKFRNNSETNYLIKKGERCCQGIFLKYGVVDDDDVTNERAGGYGSTGK